MPQNNVSARAVKAIREQTGAGVMDAKAALAEAGGDMKKALQILKEKGVAKAVKKGDRATSQGLVHAYIHGEGRIGVLLEVNVETDFVARNEEFQRLVHDLALHIAAAAPQSVEELFSQPFVRDADMTVRELINQKIAKLGENIKVKRFARYVLGE